VVGALLSVAVLFGSLPQPTHAAATTEGIVALSKDGGATFFGDNPSTTAEEGIPSAGNSIVSSQGTNQTRFEGRVDDMGTSTIADDVNENFDIHVGYTAYGSLVINTGTELRDMDLIIGEAAVPPGGSVLRAGTGYVFIRDAGSLYNNDPAILPFPFFLTGDSPSINDRSMEAGAAMGFDLYVGQSANGNMEITQQGRAEIQDAAIVGNFSGTIGTLTVDGVGSFLQSGGFETASNDPNEVHYMIVGRFGSGTMSITNGGQSFNSGAVTTGGGGNNSVFAAVIGSNLAAINTATPGAGYRGTVVVDGLTSKWTVAGNLQIGGFHDVRDGAGINSPANLAGNLAEYPSDVGQGTLNVSNGGLVSIITPPLAEDAASAPNRLDLLVGRFGHVTLTGGRIELHGAFNTTNPQTPTQTVPNGRLINDGTVEGNGSISVLQFRNRVLGDVLVHAGQKLSIAATGTYDEGDNIPVNTEAEYPMSNYGLIEVIGTETARAEIEFQRNLVTVPTSTDFTRPFLNLQIPGPLAPNGRTEGKILGQDAIMRFRSGLDNFADLSFTGGTNIVSGIVINEVGGTVFVDGAGTTVTFEDRVFNFGHFALEPNISLITLNSDFMMGGTAGLSTTFGGRPTGQEISHLAAVGDITLNGALSASLFTAPGVPAFSPQPGDQFEILSAAGELLGNFTSVQLPGCINGGTTCFVGFPDYNLDVYFIQAFGVPAAGGGADFNGDGIVDEIDLAVWRQNLGGPGPAGDANGDGIVNGLDFFVWQDQVGTPGMPPGAGSGGASLGAVPEPTSLALLASGALLALAWRRRRAI
jgi:T5SS/PEP-CTERM-associated repeat protein